jgi:hypothetical protein
MERTLMELIEEQVGGLLPARMQMKKVSKISFGRNFTGATGSGGVGGRYVGIGASVSCHGGDGEEVIIDKA